MPNYKDTNNNLHFLNSVEFEYLLPADCVAITDEEAKEIEEINKPVPIQLTPQEKLANAGLNVDELKILLGL